jgi:phospholipid/cholesterol/gamma-HCH transport system substrate-binding protein
MSRNVIETVLGAVVLIVAVAFVVWAYGRSNVGDVGGYTLHAKFDKVDGLDVGADVRISGIKVGRVLAETLDPQTYQATVTFDVRNDIKLPADSSAAILSSSLLGGKFLGVTPGGDEKMLQPGGEITITQSSINLEDLIGRFIYGSASGGGAKPGGQGAPAGGGQEATDPFATGGGGAQPQGAGQAPK